MVSRNQRAMKQPINVIFQMLKTNSRAQIWLQDNRRVRIEGKVKGLDEYMNLVLEDAEELDMKTKTKRHLGNMMLKGDSITLIVPINT